MDDQRDYAEEAYNRHVLHTGGGEIQFCEDEFCPYYVEPQERSLSAFVDAEENTMERCIHCNGEIYWHDATQEWRHYSNITEHEAEAPEYEPLGDNY